MDIDIGLCTYRRPHVAETLRSLARLKTKPDWKVRVIVADNDETPSAKELVEQVARETSLTLTYIHAPARNISIARNACLDAATAPLMGFIDDDEIADAGWLNALVSAIDMQRADVVLGPVRAIYPPDCPDWMKKIDMHSTKPVWVNGEIITGYTGNVLMRREAPAIKILRFRTALGQKGGEDTFFFSTVHYNGGKFAYAPDAIASEIVPQTNATLGWLLKRRFRSGQTHGLLLMERCGTKPLSRIKKTVIASLKALFCFILIVPNLGRAERMRFWLLRGTMHLGVVARLLGKQEISQYGISVNG